MTAEPGPSPYEGFEGRVERNFADSRPWWPSGRAAPAGAPNVILMLADDMGFSDIGCYGSEIATPQLDATAAAGVRYVNFHATPLCSPSRASLLTGLSPHAAGMGYMALGDTGFPSYRGSSHPTSRPWRRRSATAAITRCSWASGT